MRRTLKITLLSLGVVLGYGFGIAHVVHHHRYGHARYARMHDCMHACRDEAYGRGPWGDRHHDGRPHDGPRHAPPGSPDTSMR